MGMQEKIVLTTEQQLDIIYKMFQKHLVPICGPELLSIPIYIDETAKYPAYTTATGIYISGKVAKNDPYNVHVYVMHEIMHHVINNDELTLQYPANMVNYAEDFWINYQQKKLWGFDVKQVKYKGIYNTKYGKMLPHESCKCFALKYKNKKLGGCGSLGYANSSITKIARKLRKKFNLGNRYREGKLIACDATDLAVFEAYQNKLSMLASVNNLPVDLSNLVEGVFMRAYLEKPFIEKETPFLSTQQALTYCWDLQKIKATSKLNPEKAALATVFYVQNISAFDQTIRVWIALCKETIRECVSILNRSRKVSKKLKAADRRKYKAKQRRAEKRLERLLKIKPLFNTLKEHPVERRFSKTNRTNALTLSKPPSKRQLLVSVYSNDSTKLLRLLSSMTARRYLATTDLLDAFIAAFKDVEIENEYERLKKEQEKKNKEKDKVEDKLSEIINDFGKDALDKGEGPSDSEEQEDTKEDSNISSDSSTSGEFSDDEDPEYSDGEDEYTPDEVIPVPGSGGKGQGKGDGTPTKTVFEIMSELSDTQMRKLHHILMRMQEFETALSTRKSKAFDEYATTLDIIPAFGNDMSRLHQNEVALLHNSATQMLFYSKLADNSLNVLYPQNNKRNPVILLIDASGSMHGNPYETATGFALAMLKKLAEDKRGGALVIFSYNVAHKFVLKVNEKLKLNKVLEALLTPQFGGTNFDKPLYQAYEIKKEQKWKSITTIMITDGECSISPSMFEYLKTQKSNDDRLIAGLVKGSDHGFRGLNDETYKISKDNITNVLTKIGNSAL